MQTLIFNTVTKTLVLFEGIRGENPTIETFKNIQTVAIRETGFYEAMQTHGDNTVRPVFRTPIANTNMVLVHE